MKFCVLRDEEATKPFFFIELRLRPHQPGTLTWFLDGQYSHGYNTA
jgi:hypothetical protein